MEKGDKQEEEEYDKLDRYAISTDRQTTLTKNKEGKWTVPGLNL